MLHPSHRRTRPGLCAAATIAALITLLAVVTSCGDDGDDGPTADDTTTTTAKSTTSSSTTVPPEKLPQGHFIELKLPDDLTAEEKEVAEAYRDALEAFARALRDPGDDTVDLSSFYAPGLRAEAEKRIEKLDEDGHASRSTSTDNFMVEVVAANITDEGAGMLVCLTDRSETVDVETGAQVTKPDEPHQVAVVLSRDGDGWLLSRSARATNDDGTTKSCDT